MAQYFLLAQMDILATACSTGFTERRESTYDNLIKLKEGLVFSGGAENRQVKYPLDVPNFTDSSKS